MISFILLCLLVVFVILQLDQKNKIHHQGAGQENSFMTNNCIKSYNCISTGGTCTLYGSTGTNTFYTSTSTSADNFENTSTSTGVCVKNQYCCSSRDTSSNSFSHYNKINRVDTDSSITIKHPSGYNPYDYHQRLSDTYQNLSCQNTLTTLDKSTSIKSDGSNICPFETSMNRPTSTGCVYDTMAEDRSCRVMYTTGSESSGGGRDENLPVGLPCEKNTDCHRFYSMTCSNNYCSAPFMNSTNFVEFPNSRFFTSNDPRLPSDP